MAGTKQRTEKDLDSPHARVVTGVVNTLANADKLGASRQEQRALNRMYLLGPTFESISFLVPEVFLALRVWHGGLGLEAAPRGRLLKTAALS